MVSGCRANSSAWVLVKTANEPATLSFSHFESRVDVGITFSQALADGKPVLLFFRPVEMCMIRYCLQPALVESRLARRYGDRMSMVVVPVYAVNTPEKPLLPVVDLGVYLVEPFASWMPELVHTQFGWGIDAPGVALIDPNGGALYRGNEFFDVEILASYVE